MGNLSKPSFFDAGANPPPSRPIVVTNEHGQRERRLDKYPNGFVERWVDPKGNVVFEQIIPPGVPRTRTHYDTARSRILRRPGQWIEHKACPLSSGTMDAGDFPPSLQAACRKGTYGRGSACRHVEHEIARRQHENAQARAERHAAANHERVRKERLEREQADQTRRLNDNIERLVGAVAAGQQPSPPAAATPSSSAPAPAPVPPDIGPGIGVSPLLPSERAELAGEDHGEEDLEMDDDLQAELEAEGEDADAGEPEPTKPKGKGKGRGR